MNIEIIQTEAVKLLANKHGLTNDQVMLEIVNGNIKLTNQLKQLINVAVDTIQKM
jgi:hypothetical protein